MHITYFNSHDNQKLNETFSYIYIGNLRVAYDMWMSLSKREKRELIIKSDC